LGETERATLFAQINGVSSGDHEVSFVITRSFLQSPDTAENYIDNVMVFGESEPEPEVPVGGEFIPLDSTALVLAGLQSSAIWMLPVLAGIAGSAFGVLYIKHKRN